MATQTNAIVAARASGTISRPSEYLGTVKHIPVYLTGDFAAADTLVLSEVFGQNTKVVGVHLTNTAMGGTASVDVGVTGTTNSIMDGVSVVSAGEINYQGVAVDVSNKAVLGVVNTDWASGTVSGYILVVQDL